ncbi:MAG: prephenate dehydrogenase/arogenate dehydrogenase family protein [Chloroflexota bacterium]|nr:prephenate dehydrogenase/arogenate dehydrogenase family protein [Chloroflexota bacterium]
MSKSRVTIVGLGLIGGSMGLAIKKSKLDLEVIGHDKNSSVAGRAQKRGAVDTTKWNLIDACDGAGLIILALPVDGIKDTLAALQRHLAPGVIVTDTATTKAPVLDWARNLPDGVNFVGGNPVLRPDKIVKETGIDAADADLFRGATYCLTPSPRSSGHAIDTMSNLATTLGAKPYFIDAAEHDGLMAGVQHLPAVLATALLATITRSQGWREMSRVASADFHTATGLTPQSGASGSAEFIAHRADLIRWIDAVSAELNDLREMIDRKDEAALKTLVDALATERDRWLSGRQQDAGASVDLSAIPAFNPARLFLGGLVDRTPKPKK